MTSEGGICATVNLHFLIPNAISIFRIFYLFCIVLNGALRAFFSSENRVYVLKRADVGGRPPQPDFCNVT